ncbi:MAG TPA: flavin reductase family protein [Acidimicrobiales bacterium]|jgi:3-hydroxy-9,10-secoandrosta-1,3,5(10)-triene-9,17-dione monooxygenase reductase component|nr:flavin reductase family protein [Acidimicrobiales bacterium]
MSAAPAVLDERTFRDLAGRFATGVVVITAEAAQEPGGCAAMTANSFTSVCLDPPTVLVCVQSESRTARAIGESRRFAVSVLRRGQEELANVFARRGGARAGLERTAWSGGVPVVLDAMCWFVCRADAFQRAGDHEIVLGTVEHARAGAGHPLIFYRGSYDELAGRTKDAEWCWYS